MPALQADRCKTSQPAKDCGYEREKYGNLEAKEGDEPTILGSERSTVSSSSSVLAKRATINSIVAFIVIIAATFIGFHLLQKRKQERQAIAAEAAKPKKVTGQIYIVQQNGEAVKLGGVQIRILTDIDNVAAQIAKKNTEAMSNLNALREEENKLSASLQDARNVHDLTTRLVAENHRLLASIDEGITAAQEAIAEERLGFNSGNYIADQRKFISWEAAQKSQYQHALDTNLVRLATTETEMQEKENAEANLAAAIRGWETPQIYFGLTLGDVITTAMSDADGRFAVDVPKRGTFVLAAQASRLTVNGREEYGWLVSINPENIAEILLNNSNLLPLSR